MNVNKLSSCRERECVSHLPNLPNSRSPVLDLSAASVGDGLVRLQASGVQQHKMHVHADGVATAKQNAIAKARKAYRRGRMPCASQKRSLSLSAGHQVNE